MTVDADFCLRFLREVRDVAFATVDEDGLPAVRVIDIMMVEGGRLYFVAARGKAFYEQVMRTRYVAIVGQSPDYRTCRLRGPVEHPDDPAEQRRLVDRVFELNRDFRNEGVDATHAPEFTMVEAYQAYGNYDTIGALVKQLVQDTAMDVFGTHKVTLLDGSEYDFGGEWKTISMYDSLSEALGEEIVPNGGPDNPGTSVEHLGAIADKLGVERDDVENHGKLVEHLWEHFYEDKLFEPTFVRDFPVETSPLVKGHRSKPGVVEKWDLYVRGFELATGYSELNDPVVQRERFVAQAKDALAGDEEACDIDEDFLEALGVGMPPAGGMGMGIDRLLIALTGATIRETITFPLVKPILN